MSPMVLIENMNSNGNSMHFAKMTRPHPHHQCSHQPMLHTCCKYAASWLAYEITSPAARWLPLIRENAAVMMWSQYVNMSLKRCTLMNPTLMQWNLDALELMLISFKSSEQSHYTKFSYFMAASIPMTLPSFSILIWSAHGRTPLLWGEIFLIMLTFMKKCNSHNL